MKNLDLAENTAAPIRYVLNVPALGHARRIAPLPSGVDLTFATHLAAGSPSECQIQNSTRNLYLLVVLRILTFAKVAAAKGCEC
jgi:hypothetical protein